MNENEEPMMMMSSMPQHNGNGYIGSTNYLPQNFSSNVQYIPDTLAKPPFNTPFMREASQRHSRNYIPAQNGNQSRFIQSRGEGNIADHYFNYHQNNQHQMVSFISQHLKHNTRQIFIVLASILNILTLFIMISGPRIS